MLDLSLCKLNSGLPSRSSGAVRFGNTEPLPMSCAPDNPPADQYRPAASPVRPPSRWKRFFQILGCFFTRLFTLRILFTPKPLKQLGQLQLQTPGMFEGHDILSGTMGPSTATVDGKEVRTDGMPYILERLISNPSKVKLIRQPAGGGKPIETIYHVAEVPDPVRTFLKQGLKADPVTQGVLLWKRLTSAGISPVQYAGTNMLNKPVQVSFIQTDKPADVHIDPDSPDTKPTQHEWFELPESLREFIIQGY